MRVHRVVLMCAAILVLGMWLFLPDLGARAQSEPAEPAAGYVGSEVCAACHEMQHQSLEKTTHGRTSVGTWEGSTGCESCHGPGAAHVEAPTEPGKIRAFSKIPRSEATLACLTCHERGEHSRWEGSSHDTRDLSCLTCHKIHHEGPPNVSLLVKESEFATCGTCHLKRKASLMRSAHMPLREGNMTCSSCHDPHGGNGPSMLRQDTVNENCYACHTEKRSPVLWEHPPVRENCLTCHDPHGSLHPRMQVAKQPRICQQCHDETRHPTQPYSDASASPEFFPNARMFDRGCLNCHSQIHGSNHPAGMRFLR